MLDYNTDKSQASHDNNEDNNETGATNANSANDYYPADGGSTPSDSNRNYDSYRNTPVPPVAPISNAPVTAPYSYNSNPYAPNTTQPMNNNWYGNGSYAASPNNFNNAYTYGNPPTATLEPPPAPPMAPAKATPTPQPQRRGPGWLTLVAAVLVAVILSGLVSFVVANNATSNKPAAASVQTQATSTGSTVNTASLPSTTNTQGLLTVQQVSNQVRPAVVQITAQQAASSNGNVFGNSSSTDAGGEVDTGVGSGVIYDKTGYILTNAHVVNGADNLVVTLPDDTTFQGTLVGQDTQTDLAVVKIDPAGATLPVATLGDSSTLKVGDGLVAIGNALALPGGPTVTAGVVSALDRSIAEPAESSSTPTSNSPFGTQQQAATASGPQLYGLVQTDAAINPGNSGGALVDMHGQVIGINTLVAGQAEPGVQAQGIGFAISINQAKQIAQQLVANGKVSHPFLGISYQLLTPAIAQQLGLNIKNGSVVMQVQANSPAAQAGLKRGDVITAIDGQAINSESALGQILNTHKVGDKVSLAVTSTTASGGNGQSRTVQVTLGERPAGS